jgi:histone H3/H4
MAELPIAPFKRIVKTIGGSRVSQGAAEELREAVEDISMDIAGRATRLANHAGRKTITADDIKLAAKA